MAKDMPYKRRYRKKRGRRRKSAWSRKRSTVAQVRAPIADSQLVKMKYCHVATLNPGVGGNPATHIFRANDGYDPDATGVGHQPYSWDQWANFYDHVTVIGSKMRATFNPPGSNPATFIATLHVADDTTTTNNVELLMERTGTIWKWIGNSGAGSNPGNTLTKKFSTKKFFNVTNVKDADDLRGKFNASPIDDAYYHVSAFDPNGGDMEAFEVIVEIEYICLLSERKDLLQS